MFAYISVVTIKEDIVFPNAMLHRAGY